MAGSSPTCCASWPADSGRLTLTEPGPFQGVADLAPLLPDALVAVDAEGRVVWANAAAEDLLGMPVEPSLGRNALDFIHPEDVELVANSLVSIRGKEVGTAIEIRLRAAQGWKLVEVVGTNQLEHPRVGAVVLALRDLTKRRRWEVAGDDVSRFRALVHHSATVFMLLDAGGTVQSVSAAITRLLGHDQELVEGRPLVDFVADDDRDKVTSAIDEVLASPPGASSIKASVEADFIRRQNGDRVPVQLDVVNLLDDPTVAGLIVSAHDITDLRRSLEQLAQAKLELARRERLATVGQLASMIGHELRNPLAAVTNAHFLIRYQMGDKMPELMDKQLAMAERETLRAVDLADNLMAYVRPRQTRMKELDLAQLVSNVIESTPPPVGVSVATDIGPVRVVADPDQLTEIVANLVTNAYHAVSDGGTVSIAGRRRGETVVLEVRDDGEGILPDVAGRAFEPFVSTKLRGTGLGLAIVQRLVEEHGGTVTLTDHPDGGALAVLSLPAEGAARP